LQCKIKQKGIITYKRKGENMKTNVTFKQESFYNLNVPELESYCISNIKLPNLKIGKTYYKLNKKNIEAFRLLAISAKMKSAYTILSFLVQTPNSDLTWVDNYLTETSVIFEDYKDYIKYLQGEKQYNVNKSDEWYNFKNLLLNSTGYNEKTEYFENSWYIDEKTQTPKTSTTIVKYFMILENSVEICLKQKDGHFNTKEECIANQLNGFIIDDFEQEVQNIRIKTLPNQSVKTILHVIEIGA
jgi:hypothetical protein